MLKIRFSRLGRKKFPVYRIVVIEHSKPRNGRPIASIGYYNPITKDLVYNKKDFKEWVLKGAKPTETLKFIDKKGGKVI